MAEHHNCEHCELLEQVQKLQRALSFWLPGMPDRVTNDSLYNRLDADIALLVGYDGGFEASAEDLGWIGLKPGAVNALMGTTREPVVVEPQGNAGESCSPSTSSGDLPK